MTNLLVTSPLGFVPSSPTLHGSASNQLYNANDSMLSGILNPLSPTRNHKVIPSFSTPSKHQQQFTSSPNHTTLNNILESNDVLPFSPSSPIQTLKEGYHTPQKRIFDQLCNNSPLCPQTAPSHFSSANKRMYQQTKIPFQPTCPSTSTSFTNQHGSMTCGKTNKRLLSPRIGLQKRNNSATVIKRLDFSEESSSNQIDNCATQPNEELLLLDPFVLPPKQQTPLLYSPRRNNTALVTSPNNKKEPSTPSQLQADRFIPQRCTPSEMEITKHLIFTSNDASNQSQSSNQQQSNTSPNGPGQSSTMNMPYQFESCLESRLLESSIQSRKIFKFKASSYGSPVPHQQEPVVITDHSMRTSPSNKQQSEVPLYNNQENIKRSGNFSPPCSPKHSVQTPSSAKSNFQNTLQAVYSCNKQYSQMTEGERRQWFQGGLQRQRSISLVPERVLDAPKMVDDFYLNLLDWSSQNMLAVALYDIVYLWDANNGSIHKLMQCSQEEEDDSPRSGSENTITSVSWTQDGSHLAIGTNDCTIEIWNVERRKMVRKLLGHHARVGSLSWHPKYHSMLSSGSRDGKILNHDVRVGPGATSSNYFNHHETISTFPNQVVSVFAGHTQEVCGLKWSPDGSQLASGGNDNTLHIWDVNGANYAPATFTFTEHVAAVKALAWCPWQSNLLASGGGTADRKIHFWNTSTGSLAHSVDTKSQVCSLLWSKYDRELVSSHGFSQNQLIVWKYPSLRKVAELTGHTSRVLHLAQSPDGSSVVSAAGDETLRFWKVFSSASDMINSNNSQSNGTKQFGRFFGSSSSLWESHGMNDMMNLR